MTYQKTLVSLVAIFALAISLIASVSASSLSVEVSGVDGNDIAVFAGQTIPVRVVFTSDINATDVRVKAWVSGESEYAVSTDRFDVVADKVYSKLVSVQVPSNVDPTEDLKLEIRVESRNDGMIVEDTISLSTQRESYNVEILDVNMNSEVTAGTSLPIDLVLKNRGLHSAEDTFVKVRIPALGIEQKAYFGDLSPVDQSDPDMQDSAEKRIVLNIPSSALTGLYLVELQVYNADSNSVVTKRVSIVGESDESTSSVTPVDKKDAKKNSASNATLVLTIVLAIIFVVLLVVLIVLLTRKPESKTEEFGESYY